MITDVNITYYKKTLDDKTRIEKWEKYYFDKVWTFFIDGSKLNNGYDKLNSINVRIPMEYVKDKNIFAIGDIIAIGKHGDIEEQKDLLDTKFFNVTAFTINDFGYNQHVHLERSLI